MASILNVDKIRANGSTTDGLTINSDGVVLQPQKPHALVTFTNNQGYVSKANGTVLDLDVVTESNGGNHYDTSTFKFTCPIDGLYNVAISTLSLSNEDDYGVYLYKNNDLQLTFYTMDRTINGSVVVKCSADDELYFVMAGTESLYEGGHGTTGAHCWASYTFLG